MTPLEFAQKFAQLPLCRCGGRGSRTVEISPGCTYLRACEVCGGVGRIGVELLLEKAIAKEMAAANRGVSVAMSELHKRADERDAAIRERDEAQSGHAEMRRELAKAESELEELRKVKTPHGTIEQAAQLSRDLGTSCCTGRRWRGGSPRWSVIGTRRAR